MALILVSVLAVKIILPFAFSLTDYSWMLSGDATQVIVSWTNFVKSPWEYPLTVISSLVPGSHSTVLQTDSIPWLSLFFKYISQTFHLGSNWNFYGLWLISCWVFQGVFAKLIATELKLKFETKWFLIIYLLFAPILLFRFGHTSLMAEWLVLAAIYDSLKVVRNSKLAFSMNATYIRALILPLFAVGVHPYLFALITPWYLIIILMSFTPLYKKISYYVVFLIGLYAAFNILGFTAVRGPSGGDFGACNTDVLFLFNSFGTSKFIPQLRSFWCQNEGFSYIGLSGLILFFIFFKKLKLLVKQTFKTTYGKVFLTLLFLCFMYALASPIRFGGNAIIYLPFYDWIEPIPSIFRASGRWMFLVFYFLMISLVYLLDRSDLRNKKIVIASLVLLHLIEFSINFHSIYPINLRYSISDVDRVAKLIPEAPSKSTMKLVPSMVSVFCGMEKKQWDFDEWGVLMMALAKKNWMVDSIVGARIDQEAIEDCHRRNIFYESLNIDYQSLKPLILKSKSIPHEQNYKELLPNIYLIY
jgi:hypothetical protein